MEPKSHYTQILQDILKDKAFHRLDAFKDPQLVGKLSLDDRSLLSRLLMMRGQNELGSGDGGVIETFDWVLAVTGNVDQALFQQGKLFLENGIDSENIACLRLACERFEQALEHDETLSDVWVAWANTLVRLGISLQDMDCFAEADIRFAKAEQLLPKDSVLFWDWGLSCYYMGKFSGEASDFSVAIKKYERAEELGCQDARFLNDFANAVKEIGDLLGDLLWYNKAKELYAKACEQAPSVFEYHFNFAELLSQLYRISADEVHFDLSHESFHQASILEPDETKLWLEWGQLLLCRGQWAQDEKLLQGALNRFRKANRCNSEEVLAIMLWVEALLALGGLTENCALIREAEEKIITTLEIFPENSELWIMYGFALMELGYYFDELDFVIESIGKFQYAISLDEHASGAWKGLAQAKVYLGETTFDLPLLEEAIHCFAKAEPAYRADPLFFNEWGGALMKLAILQTDKTSILLAIEKFEHSLHYHHDESPAYLDTLYNYGCALDFLGDFNNDDDSYRQAVSVLLQVNRLDPSDLHVRYNLAVALTHLGEASGDVGCFQKAIDLFSALVHENKEDDFVWNDWGVTLLSLSCLILDPSFTAEAAALKGESEVKFLQAAALGNTHAFYNLACLYSLQGETGLSIDYLYKAHSHGALPQLEDLRNDDWLIDVRATRAFSEFMLFVAQQDSLDTDDEVRE